MGLGRGLGEILFEVEQAYEKNLGSFGSEELQKNGVRIEDIETSLIVPNPYQPRKHFDEKALQELSDSIKEHGLLQPIVVVEKENGYVLIAGERRLRAHKLANIDTIKAIIADVAIDQFKLRELALIENIQREDLNAIELANCYSELIEVHNITHDELSKIISKSRSQITNTIRLLKLSSYVQESLIENKITQGHAKILVGLEEEKQRVLTDTVVGQRLSVRELETLIHHQKSEKNTADSKENTHPIVYPIENYRHQIGTLLPFEYNIKKNKIEIILTHQEDVERFLLFLKKS